MDYIVVSVDAERYSYADYRLRLRVSDQIDNGYKPIGGVSVIESNGTFYFSQAMIKEQ